MRIVNDEYFAELYCKFREMELNDIMKWKSIEIQLAEIRSIQHKSHLMNKSCNAKEDDKPLAGKCHPKCNENSVLANRVIHTSAEEFEKWANNTTTGDSILNNIQESRLSKKYNVKIRDFPGADINCMHKKLNSLLIKDPTNIILHISTHDHHTSPRILY